MDKDTRAEGDRQPLRSCARPLERRREQVDALRARWAQSFLAGEEVQAELALHAERVARLERMRRLAEADDRGPLVIRVRVAIDREAERHESRMTTLEAAFRSDEGKP
jgi:hypothetical protein